jgi:hypothetical protein
VSRTTPPVAASACRTVPSRCGKSYHHVFWLWLRWICRGGWRRCGRLRVRTFKCDVTCHRHGVGVVGPWRVAPPRQQLAASRRIRRRREGGEPERARARRRVPHAREPHAREGRQRLRLRRVRAVRQGVGARRGRTPRHFACHCEWQGAQACCARRCPSRLSAKRFACFDRLCTA